MAFRRKKNQTENKHANRPSEEDEKKRVLKLEKERNDRFRA